MSLPRDTKIAIAAFLALLLLIAVLAFIGYDAWTTPDIPD